MTVVSGFMMIGIAVGMLGCEKMFEALMDGKKARQYHERTDSLLEAVAAKYGIEREAPETFSILAVLQKYAAEGAMAGLPAALVVYNIAAVLQEMARRNPAAPPNCPAKLYTTLEVLGWGSRAGGVVCLCVIAAGFAWAVLWYRAAGEIQEDLLEARAQLHGAQERKWLSECDE